ncbi:MAG: M48 family metallopeptidase [Candidatus Latescibacterota bacterium]|nr:MAG: M48 family metallopeptidase [Candidatus Latescibacterota bacterium]
MPGHGLFALAFGPDLPSHGTRVEVELGAAALRFRSAEGVRHEVQYESLSSHPGGWRGDGLQLEWSVAAGTYLLSFTEAAAADRLEATAPRALQSRLHIWRREQVRARGRLRRGLLVAAALVSAPFLIVGWLLLNGERIAALAVRRIPVEWEVELGQQIAAGVWSEEREHPAGAATAALASICRQLLDQVETPFPIHCHLVENDAANAFAVPGGTIVVWTGLVRSSERAEELAGVVAHEIQHVVQRHSMTALVRAMGLRAALTLLFDSSGALGNLVAEMAASMGELRFSRTQEREADAEALRMLRAAGIDPRGLGDFFARLAVTTREPPPFLSTHPSSRERASRIAAESGSFRALSIDWGAVQADLEPAPAPVAP